IFNIVIYGGSWLGSLIAGVWFLAWWFNRHVTSGEIRELKARCKTLEERRRLAEQENKITANKLATMEAQLATAEGQQKSNKPAEVIAGTIHKIQSSTAAAITSNNEIGRMLKTEPATGPKLYVDPKDFGLTEKSNK